MPVGKANNIKILLFRPTPETRWMFHPKSPNTSVYTGSTSPPSANSISHGGRRGPVAKMLVISNQHLGPLCPFLVCSFRSICTSGLWNELECYCCPLFFLIHYSLFVVVMVAYLYILGYFRDLAISYPVFLRWLFYTVYKSWSKDTRGEEHSCGYCRTHDARLWISASRLPKL